MVRERGVALLRDQGISKGDRQVRKNGLALQRKDPAASERKNCSREGRTAIGKVQGERQDCTALIAVAEGGKVWPEYAGMAVLSIGCLAAAPLTLFQPSRCSAV